MNSPQSVTRKGWSPSLVTMRPWKRPIPREIRRTSPKARGTDTGSEKNIFPFNNIGSMTPESAIREPIERSIPPVMITKATPIEMIPKSPIQRMVLVRVAGSRKDGCRRLVVTKSNTSNPKITRSLGFSLMIFFNDSILFSSGGKLHDSLF